MVSKAKRGMQMKNPSTVTKRAPLGTLNDDKKNMSITAGKRVKRGGAQLDPRMPSYK